MSKQKWPWGIATTLAAAYAAAIAIVIDNTKTLVTTDQLTGNTTINVTPSAEQAVGDELIVKTSADGTNRTITWGTSCVGAATVITANKSNILRLVYDGANFVLSSNNQTN